MVLMVQNSVYKNCIENNKNFDNGNKEGYFCCFDNIKNTCESRKHTSVP